MAWQTSTEAGEDALTELRIILDETLERVRSEVFSGQAPDQAPAPSQAETPNPEKEAAPEPPAGSSSTGGPGDATG
jgi:hypothetical protein